MEEIVQASNSEGNDEPVSSAPDMAEINKTLLGLVRDAYRESTDYMDANIRPQWERNLRQFHSRHAIGSRYLSDAWKLKPKFFRPKTRAMVKKAEAAAAVAYFSTTDVVNVTATNDSNKRRQASAKFWNAALNHRLTKTIPWYLTLIGAIQEAKVIGCVVSYQYWNFDTNAPDIELRPIENIRFHPGANWRDPINTSPYLIDLIPMYVQEVRESAVNRGWNEPTDQALVAAKTSGYDSTRAAREKSRADPMQPQTAISEFDIVWVRRVIIRKGGQDYQFYTLGEEQVLSYPVEIGIAYPHLKKGTRPYVLGTGNIEVHRNNPSSDVEQTEQVQTELNDLINNRMENVKLVLNKRYLVRRGKNVDIRSLTRNVAGSVTLADNPKEDIEKLEWNDVTASSYKEQDLLNLDFDDLSGTFSGSSVQSNRNLNETVGGMNLLSASANQVGDYNLKTFNETWVEPVLSQVLRLEQYYEDDLIIMEFAAEEAKLVEKYGIDQLTDELLMADLTLSINVGMGATNPINQIERFMAGIKAMTEAFGPEAVQRELSFQEVATEIFGKLGHKDGKRFFNASEDPRIASLTQQINALQTELQQKKPPELIAAETKLKSAQAVKTLVEAFYGSTQAGQTIASIPEVAPVADIILKAAGYTPPNPAGVDPNLPVPAAPIPATEGALPSNTSPLEPDTGFRGVNAGIEAGV